MFQNKLLIIKHGALGDIVLAFAAFAAIREAHPTAHITLLTTAPFADFLAASPWFDRVQIDPRPAPWNFPEILKLRGRLRGYGMVYDLQTSARSSRYFQLAGRPLWSGIAPGCAFPHTNQARNAMHTRERLTEQLAQAGIAKVPAPDLSWLHADTAKFNLPEIFCLLVPQASPHRPEKRWPAANFNALARKLPMPCVVVGAGQDEPLIAGAIDLTGRTSLLELAAVAARSRVAIGNDTGPMHLAAALNVPGIVLFGGGSDPALTAPRYADGGWPVILRAPNLRELPVAQVLAALP